MQNIKILTAGILIALALTGCGTTVKDTLGDPPMPNKETTAAPHYFIKDLGSTTTTIGGCVEHNAMVFVLSESGTQLGSDTANRYGEYAVTFAHAPDEVVYLQAVGVNKVPSAKVAVALHTGV